MGLSEPRLRLSDDDAKEILAYTRIALLHGSLMPAKEVLRVTSIQLSEEELAQAWPENELLSSNFILFSGHIIPRSLLANHGFEGIRDKIVSNTGMVASNLRAAVHVSRAFEGEKVRLFSVSGGNSYGSAGKHDDIDFFCVTRSNGLWSFVLKALLVARFFRIFRKDVPRLCFNFVMDEARAVEEFESAKDRLFARDALNAIVITGRPFYTQLLKESRWMRGFFPKAYQNNTAGKRQREGAPSSGGLGSRVLNSLLYYLLGSYVRLKSWLDNARFSKKGKEYLVNRIEMAEDLLLYECKKYDRLREAYRSSISEFGIGTEEAPTSRSSVPDAG